MRDLEFVTLMASAVVGLALVACGGPGEKRVEGDEIPRPLVTIEEQAEDIIDTVPTGDWVRVGDDTDALARAWAAYEPRASADGVGDETRDTMTDAIRRLRETAAAEDAPGTMQAANDISFVVIDLFELYRPALPADIGRLDALERQVVLDASAERFDQAAADLDRARAVWDRVRPSVLSHGGDALADLFESSLAGQREAVGAVDAPTLISGARNALELVDELERLY